MTSLESHSRWYQNYLLDEQNKATARLFKKPTYGFHADIQEQVSAYVDNSQLYDISQAIEIVPDISIEDLNEAKFENMLGMFRFSITEQIERIQFAENKAKKLEELLVTERGAETYDLTETGLTEKLAGAYRNNVNPLLVIDPFDYNVKNIGNIQKRIYDMSSGYSMSQYQNRAMAPSYGSVFGLTDRVRAARWGLIQLEERDLDRLLNIMNDGGLKGLATKVESHQTYIRDVIDNIGENPGSYWFLNNIADASWIFNPLGLIGDSLFGDHGVDGRMAPWNRETVADKMLRTPNPEWEHDKTILLKTLELEEGAPQEILRNRLGQDVATLLHDYPDIIENLKRSQNEYQFIAALNRTSENKTIGEYIQKSEGKWGTMGVMNMVGYGFTTDPTLPLDLAITAGLTMFSGGTWLAGRVALAAGRGLQYGMKGLQLAKKVKQVNRPWELRKAALSTIGTRIKEGVMFSRRFMPTQIVSELVWPSLKFLRNTTAFKGTSRYSGIGSGAWWRYLKSEEYLGKTFGSRILHRSIGGALEGVVWGGFEYAHMTDYDDRINGMLFGPETASVMAWQRIHEGVMGKMLLASTMFGATLGPAFGEAFTGAGKIAKGVGVGTVLGGRWISSQEIKIAQKLDYENKPWRKAFGTIIKTPAKKITKILTSLDYMTAKQQVAFMDAFAKLDQKRISEDMIKAGKGDAGAIKRLDEEIRTLENYIKGLSRDAEEAGLDFTLAYESAFKNAEPDATFTPLQIKELLQTALADQMQAIRKLGIRGEAKGDFSVQRSNKRITEIMTERLYNEMGAQNRVDDGMDKIDTDEPPTGTQQTPRGENLKRIQKNRTETIEQLDETQARLKSIEEGEEPSQRPEDLEKKYSERREHEEKAKRLREEADEKIKEKGEVDRKTGRQLQKEANELKKQARTEEASAEKLPKRPEELESQRKEHEGRAAELKEKAENLEAEKDRIRQGTLGKEGTAEEGLAKAAQLQKEADKLKEQAQTEEASARELGKPTATREGLEEEIEILKANLRHLSEEERDEMLRFFYANEADVWEWVAWYRKKGITDRLNGNEVNDIFMLPIMKFLDLLDEGVAGDVVVENPNNLLRGGTFTIRELKRISGSENITKETKEFVDKLIRGTAEPITTKELRKTVREMADLLINEVKGKDLTNFEVEFVRRLIANSADWEAAYQDVRFLNLAAENGAETYSWNRKNKGITWLYDQNTTDVIARFTQARQALEEKIKRITEGNYSDVIDELGPAVMNLLGGKNGFGIKGFRDLKPAEKRLALKKAFRKADTELSELNDLISSFQQEGTRSSQLARAQMRDIIASTAETEKMTIQKAAVRRRLYNNEEYQEKTADLEEELRRVQQHDNLGVDTPPQIQMRREALTKRIKEITSSTEQAVNNEWKDIKKAWVERQTKVLDIQVRENSGHTEPLMKSISMLRTFLHAHAKVTPILTTRNIEIDTTISRGDLLSIFETAEEGYGFLINMDPIQASNSNGTYNGLDVLMELLDRLKRADPVMGDYIQRGFETSLKTRFGKSILGTEAEGWGEPVYVQSGEIRNILSNLETHADAKARWANDKFRENGNQFANDLGSDKSLSKDEWNKGFIKFVRIKMGQVLNYDRNRGNMARTILTSAGEKVDMETISNGRLNEILLGLVNSDLPTNRQLDDFSDLGSVRDYIGPARAGNAVLASLLGDTYTSRRHSKTSVIVGKDGNPHQARVLGAEDQRGLFIQTDTDTIAQRNFEVARHNHFLGKLLDTYTQAKEGGSSQEFIDSLQQTIEKMQNEKNLRVQASAVQKDALRLIPRFGVFGPDQEIAMSISDKIAYDQTMMEQVTPSMMTTIHDSLSSLLRFLISPDVGARAQPSWDAVWEKGDKRVHVWRGIGLGYNTMAARSGSLQDAINVMFAITHKGGYEDLIKLANINYDKIVKEKGAELGLEGVKTEDDFVGYMFRKYEDLSSEAKEAITRAFFPKDDYPTIDADSSGSNIMLAIVMANEAGTGTIGGLIKRLLAAELGEEGPLNESWAKYQNQQATSVYGEVENYLIKSLDVTKDKLGNLDPKSLENLKRLVTKIQEAGLAKDIFKSPVMIDPYGAGYKKMAENLFNLFTEESGDQYAGLREIAEGVLGTEDFELNLRRVSETWGHLLADAQVKNNLGWIKKAVFGIEGFNNEKLGRILQGYAKDRMARNSSEVLSDERLLKEVDEGDETLRKLDEFSGEGIPSTGRSSTIPENTLLMEMLTVSLNKIDAMSSSVGFNDPQRIALQRTYISNLTESLIKQLSTEEMKAALERGDTGKQQRLFDETFNKYMNENIMIRSLNSYNRMGVGYDKTQLEKVLNLLFQSDTDIVNDIISNLSPMSRYGFENTLFRALSMSNEGRMFVKSALGLIANKGERTPGAEAPLGVGTQDRASFSPEKVRENTVLQAVKEISEIYDVRHYMRGTVPDKFMNNIDELSIEGYYKRWEADDALGERIREAAVKSYGQVRSALDAQDNLAPIADGQPNNNILPREIAEVEAIRARVRLQFLKTLEKIIDSRNQERPDRLDTWLHADDVTSTGRMPDMLGHLPQTVTRRFEGAPVPLLRQVQLERSPLARELRTVERGAQPLPKTDKPVFSELELSRPIPEDGQSIKKFRGNMYDVPLAGRSTMNLRGTPSPEIVGKALIQDLTSFANESGFPKAQEYLKKQEFFNLYQLYRHFVAAKEASKVDADITLLNDKIILEKELITRDWIDENGRTPTSEELNIEFRKHPRILNYISDLQHLEDSTIVSYSEVLGIDGSWADNIKNKEWSTMDLSGESLKTVVGGRTYKEALEKTSLKNITTGNMAAWLAGEANTPNRVLAEDPANPISIVEGSEIALGARVAQADDSSTLYMTNYSLVTMWEHTVSKILGLDKISGKPSPTSDQVTTFLQWWDYKYFGNLGTREGKKFTNLNEELVNKFEAADVTEILRYMDEGKLRAQEIYSDSNLAIIYMSRPVIQDQVIKNIKEQFPALEEVLQTQYNTTVKEAVKNQRFLHREGKDKYFVGPLGNLIHPHKVTGRGIVRLTMQNKVMALNNIQNQPVIDTIRLASMLNREVPMNAELSSNMAGYDPFTKFGDMDIRTARQNAAILTEGLHWITKRARGGQPLEFMEDNRFSINIGGVWQPSKFAVLNEDVYTKRYYKEAKIMFAEQTVDAFGFSDDVYSNINNFKDHSMLGEDLWAEALSAWILSGKRNPKEVFISSRRKADRLIDKKSYDEKSLEEIEKDYTAAADFIEVLNKAVDGLSEEAYKANQPHRTFEDVSLTDPWNQERYVSYAVQKWNIENEVLRRVNNADITPRSQAESAASELKVREEVAPTVPRKEGTEIQVNTADHRASLFKEQSDIKEQVSQIFEGLQEVRVLSHDDVVIMKLAFWDIDDKDLARMFLSVDKMVPYPETTRRNQGFEALGRAIAPEQGKAIQQRLILAHGLTRRYTSDAPLGPAGVLLHEIGHSLGFHLSEEGKIAFMKNVVDVELESIKTAEETIHGKDKTIGDEYTERMEKLSEELNAETMDPTTNELFGTMFAISALRRIPSHRLLKDLDYETAQATFGKSLTALTQMKTISDQTGLGDADALFKNPIENIKHWIEPVSIAVRTRSSAAEEHERAVADIFDQEESPFWEGLDFPDVRANDRIRSDTEGRTEEARAAAYKTNNQRIDYNNVTQAMKDATDDDGMVVLKDILNNSGSDRRLVNKVIQRVAEEKLEKVSGGARIETPFASFLSKLFLGQLTPNQVAQYGEMIASPFGARVFAYASDQDIPMTNLILGLLTAADAQSIFTTGAFTTATPTIHSLGIALKGDFDTVLETLTRLKTKNLTNGPVRDLGDSVTAEESPWGRFEVIFREILTREGGYVSRENAAEYLKAATARSPQGNILVNDKSYEAWSGVILDVLDEWANPKTGLWKKIVTLMIDSDMVTKETGEKLITDGVFPIKFSDAVFRNEAPDGGGEWAVNAREGLRDAFVGLIRQKTQPRNDSTMDIDILQLAAADYLPLPRDRSNSQWKNGGTFPSLLESHLKEVGWNVDRFLNNVRNGKIKFKDIDSTIQTEYKRILNEEVTLNQENSQRQYKMLTQIMDDFIGTLTQSQKRAVASLDTFTAAEWLAYRYMAKMGSSSYSFVGDEFLTPKDILTYEKIHPFIETDPIAILDSVRRGTAAQAYDKATYGNYFGVKGLGLKDIIDLYEKIGNSQNAREQVEMLFLGKGFDENDILGEPRRVMNDAERKKFLGGLKQIRRMYEYSIGTLSQKDLPEDNSFLNVLNLVSEFGTALSVAPRLAIATAIEETPHSIMTTVRDNLLEIREEMIDVWGNLRSREELNQTLRGLGHLTAHAMHHAATVAQKIGMDINPSGTQNTRGKIVKLYKFLSLGMDKQVLAARTRSAMQFTHRIDDVFSNMIGEKPLLASDGEVIHLVKEGKRKATLDEIRGRLKEEFGDDLSLMTRKEFNSALKGMGIKERLRNDILEMTKVGLLNDDLYPAFRAIWTRYRQRIVKTGIPFDDIRKDITFGLPEKQFGLYGDKISPAVIRAHQLRAVDALRELVWNASVLYAKQPILSSQPVGALSGGALASFLTRLTTYQSASYAVLRRALAAGPAMFAGAFISHMITGWMYYKLVQLQTHKTLEEMKREIAKDPMSELQEAIMSAPFMGANQMFVTVMLQMLRGDRAVSAQPFNTASQAQINAMAQVIPRAMKGVGDIQAGLVGQGSADLLNRMPIPWGWAFQVGLRNIDSYPSSDIPIGMLSPKQTMPMGMRSSSPHNIKRNTNVDTSQSRSGPQLNTETVPVGDYFDPKQNKWIRGQASKENRERAIKALKEIKR